MAKAIPEGFHTLTPQLTLKGAAEAIEFFKKAFGASEVMRAPDPSGKKIWHAHLKVGNSNFFVNDEFPEMGGTAKQSELWLYVENADAAFKRAVDAGGKAVMQPADMFWGDRMAQVMDGWGNRWSIAQHVKDVTPDEMKKAQDAFVASMKKK